MRLYVEDHLAPGAQIAASKDHAHYLRDVMRRKQGDAVALFNGRDGEWRATISALGKKGATFSVESRLREQDTEPDLWLIFAPVKRTAVDLIAQKATELGVARLQPVMTQRTVAARVNTDRLRAIAIEAAEQCGRLSVPEVAAPVKLDRLFDPWAEDRRLMYCDEAGDDPGEDWGGQAGRAAPALDALAPWREAPGEGGGQPQPWAVLIGPEGGFAPDERAWLRGLDFATPVTLGPRILRADTAALAALSLWQAALGDWRRR